MEQVFLGEYIRQRREDLGLTQAQVCEGICEPMTLSRLEHGKQTPSFNRIKALLHRLGLPDGRFVALLSKEEMEISALQKEIRADMIRFRRATDDARSSIREKILSNLTDLEQIAESDDQIITQYIMGKRAALGSYNLEHRLNMLMDAIHLTIPRFSLEKIYFFRYSLDEIELINHIAYVYAEMNQRRTAIDISSHLLHYIEKYDQELAGFAGHFCLVAHDYAIDLAYEKRYEESAEVATRGRKICVEYGHYQFLAGFLAVLAESFYYMGDKEKSTIFYYQAYNFYAAVCDERNRAIMQREMKERLGLEPQF